MLPERISLPTTRELAPARMGRILKTGPALRAKVLARLVSTSLDVEQQVLGFALPANFAQNTRVCKAALGQTRERV
jgi:hypothetical protein